MDEWDLLDWLSAHTDEDDGAKRIEQQLGFCQRRLAVAAGERAPWTAARTLRHALECLYQTLPPDASGQAGSAGVP